MKIVNVVLTVILIALLLVLLAMLVTQPVAAAPAERAPAQRTLADCAAWMSAGDMHHTLAPWTESAILLGDFRAWKTGTTLVLAFRVAECGSRWMFAKFTAGSFTTNFFPDRGLAYITAQVRGWTACAKSIITAAVAAAIRIGATVETVVGFVLMPADMCQIPGAQRQLPQCARG